MIKFERYEVSRLGDFHLSFYECVGILTHLLATSEDKSADIDNALTALVSFDYWSHGYPSNDKMKYVFKDKTTGVEYTAIFYKVNDDYLTLTLTKEVDFYNAIYFDHPSGKKVIFTHTFTDDELMEIIDYSTYEDDSKRIDHFDEDWDLK